MKSPACSFALASLVLATLCVPTAVSGQSGAPAKKLKVVVFGGHPDDPESGAGGLVALLTRQGHEVILAYGTAFRGDRKFFDRPEGEVRREESTAACRVLGATPKFLPYAHEKLVADEPTLKAVSTWLDEVKPDIVVTHWPLDTHPNHHVVSSLVWQSYRRKGGWNLYFFEVMTDQQTIAFRPELYLDIGPVREAKKRSLDEHKSQEPASIWEAHEKMHRRRGVECGVEFAEAYSLVEAKPGCPLLPVRFLGRTGGERAEGSGRPSPGRTGVMIENQSRWIEVEGGRVHYLIEGDEKGRPIVPHYDSIPDTPGADDNASGVAALIAAARAVGPREEVCFVAFDGEECGFVGSRALVAGLGEHRPEHVHVLEMIGYASREPRSQRNPVPAIPAPTVGDFLALVGTHGSRGLLDDVLATADAHPVPVQGLYLPDVPLGMIEGISHHLLRSDHAPFWRAGLPALMWTDTAEFRNPHYHRATDTLETLDYDFLAGVTRLLVHAVLSGIGADRT